MKNIRKKLEDILIFWGNKNTSIALGITFIKWIVLGSIVGIITGSAATLFLKSLELATNLRIQNTWLLLLLPIGGAFVSFLYLKYGKNSSKGNNLILEKINEDSGRIPMRMAPLVFIGTVITHLFGGSAGREGTGVQIGSAIAEGVGRFFKLDKVDTRIILMSGISSGFASVFGTPLAGTVFGLEVATLGVMSYEALIPCFTASIVGDVVSKAWGIQHIHYKVLEVPELTLITITKVAFAAVIFGLTSKLFSELTHKLKEVFTEAFENPVIKSFVGGIIIIILVFVIGTRDYLGLSIPLISNSFTSKVHPFAFLGKIAFTSLTLGAGFQGGEVTPLFVIGSTLGNSLSSFLHIAPSYLAALGLIGVFTGATNTPIASFLLGIEMFGAQGIELMFMTCVISYIFSGHTGIYTSQKIGTSKSKIIEVPHNASLSYYRKKASNKEEEIKPVLVGQFKFGPSRIELPCSKGMNIYKIIVKGGSVRMNHSSYNPDGHTWSAPPGEGQVQHIDIPEGVHTFEIFAYEYYGKVNKVNLVNRNLLNNVEVKYVVLDQMEDQEDNYNCPITM